MILVTLGTQDKSFERLLKAVDTEIKNNNIQEEVVVQAGYTKYQSEHMKVFDYVSQEEMNEYVKKSRLIITHAGVGTILTCLENNKKVIVVPRLAKYKEHTNDHQVQIAEEFSKAGYVVYLKDLESLGEEIKNMDKFNPNKLKHNTKIIETIEEFIDKI